MIRLNDSFLCAELPELFSATNGVPVHCERSERDARIRTGRGFRIEYTTRGSLHRMLGPVLAGETSAPVCEPAFPARALMIDCSRGGVPSIPFLKRTALRLSLLGLTHLGLYLEDLFEVPDLPFLGFGRGGYTGREIRELDDFCAEIGIELFPCIQTLGHLEHVFKNPRFRKYSDGPRILNGSSPEARAFMEHLILSASALFRTNRIHLGADEPWGLGHGDSLDFHAPVPPKRLYLRHLAYLSEICTRNRLRGMIWSDYLLGHSRNEPLTDEELREIPPDLILDYWNYTAKTEEEHAENLRRLRTTGCELWISPGLHSWNRFFGDFSAAAETGSVFFRAAAGHGIAGAMTTLWGDDGAESLFRTSFASVVHHLLCMKDPSTTEARALRWTEALGRLSAESCTLLGSLDRTLGGNDSVPPNWSFAKQLFYDDPLFGFLLRLRDAEALTAQLAAQEDTLRQTKPLSADDRALRKLGVLFLKALRRKISSSGHARSGWEKRDRILLRKAGREARDAAEAVRKFAAEYGKLWREERKVFGLEIPQVRLAGTAARLEELQRRISDFLKNGETIPELDLALPETFDLRDAGTAYATAVSRNHNTIWMM